MVFPGQEEERVPLRTEFAVLLRSVDLVDLRLNLFRRHGRVEDDNVRAKIRRWSALRQGRANCTGATKQDTENCREMKAADPQATWKKYGQAIHFRTRNR